MSDLTYHGIAKNKHIDATMAPRVLTKDNSYGKRGDIVWSGLGEDDKAIKDLEKDSDECAEGQFLRHNNLSSGTTAIQWWDRHQGESRVGTSSTLILSGRDRTSAECLERLASYFPNVLANLEAAGISLVDLTPAGGISSANVLKAHK
jgi:hypothetical protein